jgi:hypothetical protein
VDDYHRIGVNIDGLGKIKTALIRNGITGNMIEPALWGLLKAAEKMEAEYENFEMGPQLRKYLVKNGLNNEQIELIKGIAWRIVYGLEQAR